MFAFLCIHHHPTERERRVATRRCSLCRTIANSRCRRRACEISLHSILLLKPNPYSPWSFSLPDQVTPSLPPFQLQLLLLILRSSFFSCCCLLCCSNSRASLCMRAFTRTFNKWPAFPAPFLFFVFFFFSQEFLIDLFFLWFSPQIEDLLFDISKRQKMTNGRVEIRKFSKSCCARKTEKKSDERFLVFCFSSLNFEWHYQEKFYISLLNRSGGSPAYVHAFCFELQNV